MNIAQFQRTKPAELRLGQHFYNCYLYRLGWQDNMHRDTQELYNTVSHSRALFLIAHIMDDYQWDELPDIVQEPGLPVRWSCA
jgi:hypothetical protein